MPTTSQPTSSNSNDGYTASSLPKYFGHTEYYWSNYALANMPFLLFILLFIVIMIRAKKRQKIFIKKNEVVMETQQKAYQELQAQTYLLKEISQKLDKK